MPVLIFEHVKRFTNINGYDLIYGIVLLVIAFLCLSYLCLIHLAPISYLDKFVIAIMQTVAKKLGHWPVLIRKILNV